MHMKFKEVSLYNVKFTCNNHSDITQLVVARNRLSFCLSAVKQWHMNHTKTHVCSQFWFVTLLIPWKNHEFPLKNFEFSQEILVFRASTNRYHILRFSLFRKNNKCFGNTYSSEMPMHVDFIGILWYFFHSKKLKSIIIKDPHNSSSFLPNNWFYFICTVAVHIKFRGQLTQIKCQTNC